MKKWRQSPCPLSGCRVRPTRGGWRRLSRRRWNANFATGKLTVEYDPDAANLEGLVEVVECAGYGAEVRETSLGILGMNCAKLCRQS
jgi:hypothetical protein